MPVHTGFPVITTDLYGQVDASNAEINRMVHKEAARYSAAGGTRVLTGDDDEKVILWDTAAGSTVTLPDATGSGFHVKLVVSVLATSNSHVVKVANASDTMIGVILGARVDSGNAVLGFAAGATSDTITLNRTTTGSVSKGEWVECHDVANNVWHVQGFLTATGAAFATPFSATV